MDVSAFPITDDIDIYIITFHEKYKALQKKLCLMRDSCQNVKRPT